MQDKKKKLQIEFFILVFSIGIVFVATFYAQFLFWVCFVPILYLLYRVVPKKAILGCFIFSVALALVIFNWTAFYGFQTFAAVVFLFSTFFFVFFIGATYMLKKIKHVGFLLVPFWWLFLQFVYSFSMFNSYWADLSMFQPMLSPLIAYVSRFGITFLIVLSNVIFLLFILHRKKYFLYSWLLLIFIVVGCFFYSFESIPSGEPFTVAIVQANIQESFDYRLENAEQILDLYISQTETLQREVDLILWPEYAVPLDFRTNEGARAKLFAFAQKVNTTVILGTIYDLSDGLRNDVAMLVLANGSIFDSYVSVIPIPIDKSIVPGNALQVFSVDGVTIGPLLCYEETQGKVSLAYANAGVDFFISLANNQEFSNSSHGLYLTSTYSQLTAAEHAKYFIRSTNTGITQIINPFGKVEAQLASNTKGILVHTIYI